MTPEEMASCASQGRHWWMRPDGTFYGTAEHSAAAPGDAYLLDASPAWVAQWDDWQQAVETLFPLFDRLPDVQN